MKQYLKFLMLLILSLALIAGINSCGKESSGGIEPTPVNPTPNNGGGGGKPEPDKPDDKPIGDGKVNVFDNVISVQESEITSVASDTSAKHYTITYNADAPTIKPGNVVVVPDGDETRIILVTGAKINGNTAELDGPLGDLSYVFHDTEFILTTDPSVVQSDNIPIYTPADMPISLQKKTESGDKDGENTDKKDEKPKDPSIKGKISWYNENGKKGINSNLSVTLERGCATLSAEVGGDLAIVVKKGYYDLIQQQIVYFDENNKEQTLSFPKSEIDVSEFYVEGKLTLKHGASFKATALHWDNAETKDEKKEGIIYESPQGELDFVVAGVPVRLVGGVDMWGKSYSEFNVAAEVGYDVTFTYDSKLGFRRYDDNRNDKTMYSLICSGEPKLESNISVNGYAKLTQSFCIAPLFWFSIYDKKLIGGGLKLYTPRISTSVGAGVSYKLDGWLMNDDETSEQQHLNCGWQGHIDVDCAAQIGLYRERWFEDETVFKPAPFDWNNKDGASLKSDGGEIRIFRANYDAPANLIVSKISGVSDVWSVDNKKIKVDLDNPEKNVYLFPIRAGEPITLSFNIYDRFFNDNKKLFDTHWCEYMPSVIWLHSRYGKDEGFLFSEDHSTYTWVPKSADDYLEAEIYDETGKSISKICIGANELLVEGSDVNMFYGEKKSFVAYASYICNMSLEIDGEKIWTMGGDVLSYDLSELSAGLHRFKVIAEFKDMKVEKEYVCKVNLGKALGLVCTPVTQAYHGVKEYVTANTMTKSEISLYVNGVVKAYMPSATFLTYDISELPPSDVPYKIKVVAVAGGFNKTEVDFECKVSPNPNAVKLTLDVPESSMYQGDEVFITGTASKKCDIMAIIDNTYEQKIENATVFSIKLPTNILNKHTVEVYVMGQEYDTQSFSYVVNKKPITVAVTLPDVLSAYQSTPFTVTGSASDPCTVIVEVDGSTHQTIKDATAFTINLPTDVIGNHSVKVYVSGQDKGTQTFSYKVEKKPDTPVNPSAQVPSVSGTDIDQQNNVSGSTPNVSGQNVDQQYNSGGNAPDIKGQNLNQNYNGGGNAPDIKGTNL